MILLQQIVAGLEAGASYGLLGMAIVIVMKSTDVPNFAAAEVGLVGAYVCWTLMLAPNGPQLPAPLAILAAVLSCAALNVAIQYLLVRPFTGLSPRPLAICVGLAGAIGTFLYIQSHGVLPTGTILGLAGAAALALAFGIGGFLLIRFGIAKSIRVDHFALLLMTIGLVYVMSAVLHLIWGPIPKGMSMPWSGMRVSLGGLNIGMGQIVTIVTAFVVAIGVGAFFRSTWGVRMRAIAEDSNTARLLGINSSRISMLAWAIAGVISGITLLLQTSQTVLSLASANTLILSGFIAAVIGGFTSLGGAFLGGLIIGVGEAMAGGLIDTRLQPTIALLVVVVVLLLSPDGLTSEKKRRQV